MGRAIMIQGTSSGAGKSTLVTGLCRVLKQEGFSVAPFKAQNMSSNAYYLENGLQMAKSQAIAAYACGIEPDVNMNPVLLKPTNLAGSEVILNGEPIGYLKNFEYNELKKRLLESILHAYNHLIDRFDIVIAEGAGSPVELNLKENDIVNMGFATRTNCPVILVTDISRGGVFASVYGTMMLLEEKEKTLVKGIVINKFHGYKEHFKSGIDILENITHCPVLGVLPQIDVNIEDEDSLVDNGSIKTEKSLMEKLITHMSYREYMEAEFDKLANSVKENIDINHVLKIIGE
ncbi:cobyric acid synthase [Christensenella tenuis]|uniref:Cobyric acid synthase n=1 Tax=Christensenella tenuis TaxID=2763033 RepID=A0ABR7EER7_9FIRM|nr:cobyric acid synthase [Christensenella tenuis]MBC5648143.1 cobyric acid synthase [Christensenella tenuis]